MVAGPPHGDRPSSDDAAEDRIDTAECPVGHVDLSAGLRVEAAAFVPFTSTAAAGAIQSMCGSRLLLISNVLAQVQGSQAGF